MRPALAQDPARRLEHHRDRSLVVGAEDRSGGVADDAVFHDGLDPARRGHGVEVGAEEDRRAGAVPARQPTVEVAGARADRRAGVVLASVEPDRAQLGEHPIRDRPLLAGRARQRAQLGEEVEDPRRHVRDATRS